MFKQFHNRAKTDDDEEEGEEIKLIRRPDDGTLQLAKKYTRAILYMLGFFLIVCLILFIPLILSLRGTMTLLFQPSELTYLSYLNGVDSLSTCGLTVQPFLHPPSGRDGVALLGVGSLTEMTTALQETFRIRLIDASCTTSYYEIPSCMQISWFKHGLMVKMRTVTQLTTVFPGFNPAKVIVVVKNPFVEFAEEARDNPSSYSGYTEYLRFFDLWKQEQKAYESLDTSNLLMIYNNSSSMQAMKEIRNFAPEGLISERVLVVCYDTKFTPFNTPLNLNVLTIPQRDELCEKVKDYWRQEEWGECKFGL
jgi:hypothetical protein